MPVVQESSARGLLAEPLQLAPPAEADECVEDLEDLSTTFDVDQFQQALKDYESKGKITDEDVKFALGTPEKVLAIIEIRSRKAAYEGFGFSERLKSLEPEDLQKLHKLLAGVGMAPFDVGSSIVTVPQLKLTPFEQENLLVEIYDIFHKPAGLFKTAWQTKSLSQAYKQIRVETIRKRLQLSLFHDGMAKTFEVITGDPTFTEKFREILRKNKSWIEPLVFVGLWIPFAIYFPTAISPHVAPAIAKLSEVLRWAPPPYILSFSKFFDVVVTDEDRQVALDNGLDAAAQRIDERTGSRIKWGINLRASFWPYLIVFTILSAVTMSNSFLVSQQYATQDAWNDTTASISQLANFANLTPQQKADVEVKNMVELMNQKGEHESVNSPEMRQLHDQFVAVFSQQAAGHHSGTPQITKPNPQ